MSIDDEDQRIDLCTKVEVDIADRLVTVKSVEKKIKRLKKGRSPGIDGFTAEHLISLTQAGRGQLIIKKKIPEQYVSFLRKIVAAKLTAHQNEALNTIKLAGNIHPAFQKPQEHAIEDDEIGDPVSFGYYIQLLNIGQQEADKQFFDSIPSRISDETLKCKPEFVDLFKK